MGRGGGGGLSSWEGREADSALKQAFECGGMNRAGIGHKHLWHCFC
jgi:hypothetical protein